MEGADLRGAFLNLADLKGAHLEGATLICANLRGAKVTREQLKKDIQGERGTNPMVVLLNPLGCKGLVK